MRKTKSTSSSPALDPQPLLAALQRAGRPLRLDDLLRQADISRRLKRDVIELLENLEAQGKVARLRGGAWMPADKLKLMRGVLAIQRSGAAFVTPESPRRTGRPPVDIFIPPPYVGDAWDGDTVEVGLTPGRHGARPEGRVLSVLSRAHTEVTVRVMRPAREGERALVRPADPRLNFDMLADVADLPTPPTPGELLRATVGERLPSPQDSPLWAGKATASLGREDSAAVQENLTKLNHLIPTAFPGDVLTEATETAAQTYPLDNVEDIRSLLLVTIDGEDARDFDDAIFTEKTPNGWRLVTAIADVSLYVRPRGKLDREARERGNSYYFPTSVEPMLPEALSNGVCSLRPHEDRRVMVADMRLSATGEPQSARFYAGLMRSQARLTYTRAQAALDGQGREELEREAPGLPAMLDASAALADILIRKRAKRGSLDFDAPEAEFVLDKGRVTAVHNRERLFSHRLIEAFMITANEAVARFLREKSAPGLYRVHPGPSPEKLETLARSLRATGLPLPLPNRITDASWLPGLLKASAETEYAFLINRMALRSMMQARYEAELSPHFGLASDCYCHFTSPIRRYADLVTHRALKAALGLPSNGDLPTGQKLIAVADICNARERVAQDAEREITRRLGCLLLQNRVGEVFHGVVSGVTSFGLFVELGGMPLEGMIRVETLGNDYFDYNPDRQELRGQRTSQSYRLGHAVEVRLAEVNVGRLEVTLVLADAPIKGKGRRQPVRLNKRDRKRAEQG